METSFYKKKMVNLELQRNSLTLYLHSKFQNKFPDIIKMKILKFAENWIELRKKVFTQTWTKFMRQCEEIKQKDGMRKH